MKLKRFFYTKNSGDESDRNCLVVSNPRQNYLMLDVSNLTPEQVDELCNIFDTIEDEKSELLQGWEEEHGVSINSLWRSFKPEGIEWQDD